MASSSLRLKDYADPELLAIIRDLEEDGGYAPSEKIAAQIGIDSDHATRCVGSRLSWMRRWGWLERHPDQAAWKVTATGHALIGGRVTKTIQTMLDKLKPADRVRVTRELARQAHDSDSRQILVREWSREAYLARQ